MLPYSPELNPDEYLNCALKAGVHSGPPAHNKKRLKQKAISHMRKLQKLPKRVASYFQAKEIQYAAAYLFGCRVNNSDSHAQVFRVPDIGRTDRNPNSDNEGRIISSEGLAFRYAVRTSRGARLK